MIGLLSDLIHGLESRIKAELASRREIEMPTKGPVMTAAEAATSGRLLSLAMERNRLMGVVMDCPDMGLRYEITITPARRWKCSRDNGRLQPRNPPPAS